MRNSASRRGDVTNPAAPSSRASHWYSAVSRGQQNHGGPGKLLGDRAHQCQRRITIRRRKLDATTACGSTASCCQAIVRRTRFDQPVIDARDQRRPRIGADRFADSGSAHKKAKGSGTTQSALRSQRMSVYCAGMTWNSGAIHAQASGETIDVLCNIGASGSTVRKEPSARAARCDPAASRPPKVTPPHPTFSPAGERDFIGDHISDRLYKSFIFNGAASALTIWSCNCSRWARL